MKANLVPEHFDSMIERNIIKIACLGHIETYTLGADLYMSQCTPSYAYTFITLM